ncbi:'Cold-shock' DNA-binding domain-containing protein [Nakamurella panacisegetis]|uniref:'Cold-shock' DNA-binding domain-containing protein n=1 Tax=Nakamurella panacisegetis TaxID=1090615 RepID=A0A1H0LE03_9ACTN|nr:cold shock domain-containing protein [Nakamurella panacisegetis]SDO66428.1 'Cold-shock' DNA-binding domain-containing protein [Nakamurella panacisegetis]
MTFGTVREWHTDEGWGVIDSTDTPGGCWAHFSAVVMPGYHTLSSGSQVDFDWRSPGQDGFNFTATQVWIGDRTNGTVDPVEGFQRDNAGAYNSSVRINPGNRTSRRKR